MTSLLCMILNVLDELASFLLPRNAAALAYVNKTAAGQGNRLLHVALASRLLQRFAEMRLPVSLIELLRASPGMIMAGQAITETMSDRAGYRSLQYGAPVYESGVDILLQQQLSNDVTNSLLVSGFRDADAIHYGSHRTVSETNQQHQEPGSTEDTWELICSSARAFYLREANHHIFVNVLICMETDIVKAMLDGRYGFVDPCFYDGAQFHGKTVLGKVCATPRYTAFLDTLCMRLSKEIPDHALYDRAAATPYEWQEAVIESAAYCTQNGYATDRFGRLRLALSDPMDVSARHELRTWVMCRLRLYAFNERIGLMSEGPTASNANTGGMRRLQNPWNEMWNFCDKVL